jgi:hypothetical protein
MDYRSLAVLSVTIFGLGSISMWSGCTRPKTEKKQPPPSSAGTKTTEKSLGAEEQAALTALGYFDRTRAKNPGARNVTQEAPRAFDGYSLYNSRHLAEAYLIDMSGKVVHTWKDVKTRPAWMHMELQPNGDLIVISKASYVARLGFDSKVLWRRAMRAHHDLTVDKDGNIIALAHKIKAYPFEGAAIPVMDDQLVTLSPDGKPLRKRFLFPVLRPLISKRRLNRIKQLVKQGVDVMQLIQEGAPSDVTHTNSIDILKKAIPGIAPAGSILLSVREIDRIVILNDTAEKLLWSFGAGELQGQHHATQLKNGNIMLFDNGAERKQSRVIELDPQTGQIVWTYTNPNLFSRLRGAAQSLPNGNVLITESDNGHVIEVTREGKQVWEFWNPDVRGKVKPTRAVIYRMTRYPLDYLAPGLL